MTSSLIRSAFLALLFFASAMPTASAQTPQDQAIELYERADQARRRGEYKKAANLLEAAYVKDPNLIYQYNRIRAYQALGEPKEALRILDLFREKMGNDPEGRFTDLTELRLELTDALAQIESTPQAARPSPEPQVGAVVEARDPVSPPPPSSSDGFSGLEWTGIAIAGVGAAALLGTSPFWSGVLLDDDADQDTISDQQTISIVGLAAGGALLTGGLILFFLGGDADEEASARITPVLAPDGGGASVTLRF